MWNKLVLPFIVKHNAGLMVTNSDRWQMHKQDGKTEWCSSFRKPKETQHAWQPEAAVALKTMYWFATQSDTIAGRDLRNEVILGAFEAKRSEARGSTLPCGPQQSGVQEDCFHSEKQDSEGSERCPVQSELWLMKRGRRSTPSHSWQDDYPSVIVSCQSVESNNRTSLKAFGVFFFFFTYRHL